MHFSVLFDQDHVSNKICDLPVLRDHIIDFGQTHKIRYSASMQHLVRLSVYGEYLVLPKTTRFIKQGFSTLQAVHRFGMQKRIDLDIASALLQKAATKIYLSHPDSADRLNSIYGSTFYIQMHDFPLNLLITVMESQIMVDCNLRHPPVADVVVTGNYQSLVQIFEGDDDGDALFFSRKIKIKGNIEALVTLRNAIDSEDINLIEELSSLFGPLHRPARDVLGLINRRYSHDSAY